MSDIVIPSNQKEFRCKHCDGKIMIPRDLPPTTGPCPHCSGIITSPADDVAPAAFQVPRPPAVPTVEEKVIPTPPAGVERMVPTPAALVAETAAPVKPLEKPAALVPAKAEIAKHKPTPGKAEKSGLIPAMLILLLLAMIGGGVVYFASLELGKNVDPPTLRVAAGDPSVNEANYIRIGWQKDAYQILRGYMAATSTQGKIPYVLNGPELSGKIEDFYGGGTIIDSDTPADAFSVYDLSEEDRKRGLFMMIYDQPPQFEMKEFFRPLASLEVQYGVDEADLLLSTVARVANFAMDPLRVHAFFKRTPEGLKLDWEIFAQTKYRTLQNFTELPEVGQTGVFRVFIVEDVPDKGRAVAGTRTYRVADPANTNDTARVNVKVDSEIGRALSLINWRGTKENRPITRTVTVELKWAGEPAAPELEISRFVCWEFLGLGGQETPATASTK